MTALLALLVAPFLFKSLELWPPTDSSRQSLATFLGVWGLLVAFVGRYLLEQESRRVEEVGLLTVAHTSIQFVVDTAEEAREASERGLPQIRADFAKTDTMPFAPSGGFEPINEELVVKISFITPESMRALQTYLNVLNTAETLAHAVSNELRGEAFKDFPKERKWLVFETLLDYRRRTLDSAPEAADAIQSEIDSRRYERVASGALMRIASLAMTALSVLKEDLSLGPRPPRERR